MISPGSFARLYVPNHESQDGESLSPSMRLSEFFALHFAPRLTRRIALGRSRPRNLEAYSQSVALWARLTGDPPLSRLEWSGDGVATGELFRESLASRPGRGQRGVSPRTINKHLQAISAILGEAGPRSRRHPEAVGLVAEPPVWERMRETPPEPRPYGLPELAELAARCSDQATPATWWRRLILVAYHTGLRRQALIGFDGAPAVASHWLRRDELGTWLYVPSEASKTHRPYSVYLVADLAEHLAALPADRPWFAWPHGQSWFGALARRQGLFLHRVRKTTATQLARIDSAAAAMQLGHAGGITIRHYIGREAQAAKVSLMPRLDVEW